MSVETATDLTALKAAGFAVAETLRLMRAYAQVGMSTLELDEYGRGVLEAFGAQSAPYRDYGFPGCACISVNEEVCHGIPSAHKVLREGDLVNIDVSAELGGFYSDNGGSFILGEDKQGLSKLVSASEEILSMAIGQVRHGVRIAAVGGLIEKQAKQRGFRVIRNLCGHGIGRQLHEQPHEIPNFKDIYNRERFQKGSVIALETFISTKSDLAEETEDGWTMIALDGGFVAQHEHTIIVTEAEPIVLTAANGIAYR
jgi:methionyl aminopeptidase